MREPHVGEELEGGDTSEVGKGGDAGRTTQHRKLRERRAVEEMSRSKEQSQGGGR